MLMRKLGRSRLRVAALCLGGNTFGWTTDQTASETVLDAYVDAGGNFFDTADVYSRWAPGNAGGESETVLGTWIRGRRNRHAVVIATKVMGPMGPGPNDTGLSRQHIMAGIEASLRRLQTDYIDLYQAHWDDRDTPLEETLRAFDDLVRQGKVRYIGASNHHAWRLTRALWESDTRGSVQKTYMTDRGFAVLAAVEKVAATIGATPAQVALSWLAHRPGITAPIASATSVAQLKELFGGIDLRLDAESTAALDRASAWRDA
jgi:aryl-alcohol dehydrogenase-like predicted oxidoreductase